MSIWRRKKYIFVLGAKKKSAGKERGRFLRVRFFIIGLVIIFILFSSVIYEKNKLRRRQTGIDIIQLREIVDKYMLKEGKCPENIEEVLKHEMETGSNKKFPIFDPWGRKYEIICPGKKNKGSVDILSAGPDRNYYTFDDLKL